MTTAALAPRPPLPRPPSRGSVSARLVASIVAVGEARGVDTARALDAAAIEARLLDDPEARIPIEREEMLWDELARRSEDFKVDTFFVSSQKTQELAQELAAFYGVPIVAITAGTEDSPESGAEDA